MHGEDAREFASAAASRGFAEGGVQGQIEGAGMLLSLERHIGLAIGLTAGLFVLKVLAEWRLERRLPRAIGALVAFLEINFALFGIFTIDHLRGLGVGWLTGREVWGWLNGVAGPAFGLWPPFKDAVLGGLIWLVIAGVVLGLDAGDERVVLGGGRAGRRLARAGGIDRTNSPRELLTRGLREMWLPAWYGLRLVRRSGMMPFATFCLLFAGLYAGEDASRRLAYELIGPHEVTWWMQWLPAIGYGTGLVFEILRVCLLAAAFNLVMARVSGRNAAKPAGPPVSASPSVPGSAAPARPPWHGAPSP
jgi:hypothetical protein